MLPIGGLKEKLLAAQRGDINVVIIPSENEKDLAEIPEEVLANLEIKAVRWIDEVLEIALVSAPTPLLTEEPQDSGKNQPGKKKSSQTVRHH